MNFFSTDDPNGGGGVADRTSAVSARVCDYVYEFFFSQISFARGDVAAPTAVPPRTVLLPEPAVGTTADHHRPVIVGVATCHDDGRNGGPSLLRETGRTNGFSITARSRGRVVWGVSVSRRRRRSTTTASPTARRCRRRRRHEAVARPAFRALARDDVGPRRESTGASAAALFHQTAATSRILIRRRRRRLKQQLGDTTPRHYRRSPSTTTPPRPPVALLHRPASVVIIPRRLRRTVITASSICSSGGARITVAPPPRPAQSARNVVY